MESVDQFECPWYTPEQVQRYYERISLPQEHRDHHATKYQWEASATARDQAFLYILMQHHLAAIPSENLDLHYSQHHHRSLDVQFLFTKFVQDGRGRGGDGMQMNIFFCTVLTSLGYRVYPTGARISEADRPSSKSPEWQSPRYLGWDHVSLILVLDSDRYLIDIGMGYRSTIFPVPLTSGLALPTIPSVETQLLLSPAPGVVDRSRRRWSYCVRHKSTDPWAEVYAFTEAEFAPEDFEAISASANLYDDPETYGEYVHCSRMLMEDGELTGDISMNDSIIKMRINGDTQILDTLLNEEQRIDALEKHFGIVLLQDERDGIACLSSELKG